MAEFDIARVLRMERFVALEALVREMDKIVPHLQPIACHVASLKTCEAEGGKNADYATDGFGMTL